VRRPCQAAFRIWAREQGLRDEGIVSVAQGKHGSIWLGSFGGLGRLKPDGSLEWITHRDGLSNETIIALTPAREGGVWAGTYGGGVCHAGTGPTRCWGTGSGLSHGVITSILEDDDGSLWLSTKRGLSRFAPDRHACTNYFVADGLLFPDRTPSPDTRPMRFEIHGDVTVPGDKSITHRALMFAAAAEGESRLGGLLPGEDCRSTAAVLRDLGCDVPAPPADASEIVVRGRGLHAWRAPAAPLDCGNSGTTARLMMGWLASRPFACVLTGDASLRTRPMRRITAPLEEMGARFRELEAPDRLPVEVAGGGLRGIDYASPKASAQIKSAVLLAGVGARVPVTVTEPVLSRDHTERMLSALGAPVRAEPSSGGPRVLLDAWDGPIRGFDLQVPGDPSSAAFLTALALLADAGELRIRRVCANPTRTGFFAIVRRMMGLVAWERGRFEGGEPVSDLVVRPSRLRGVEVWPREVPAAIDEVPVLAALAARAGGETRITGAGELRVKESDRIAALVTALRAIGAEAEELPDGLVVRGSDRPLRGRVVTHGDHRIAMAFGVLAALPGNEIEIDDRECAAVSFPGYWDVLASLVHRG